MEEPIAAVRAFNRFYTRRVGALNQRFLGTELTLPEARLLFEIARGDKPLAVEIQRALGMDAGYLSRVLARFEARGWIVRESGGEDARRRPIVITAEGLAVFDTVDQRQRDLVHQDGVEHPLGHDAQAV